MEAGVGVEVEDLVVRRGSTLAVDGVSFEARHGTITAILGPNGAGKTTTVETLEGYLRPTSGRVRVLGCDPVADHRRLVPRIGVMLQEGGVYTGIRPHEVVRLFASYYDDPEDPDELLGRLGLTHARRTAWRHLSGGEKQRLSMALALVGKPEVVFLDEPTAGIDPAGRQVIRETVASLRERGACVLLTTHDVDEAERLADWVVIVDHGVVRAQGSPTELTASTDDEQLHFRAQAGLDTEAIGHAVGTTVREPAPGRYVVDAPNEPARVAALTSWMAEHGVQVTALGTGRQTLEEVFLRLTGERP